MCKELLTYNDVKDENLYESVLNFLKEYPMTREDIDEMQFRTIDEAILKEYQIDVKIFASKHNLPKPNITNDLYDLPFVMGFEYGVYTCFEGDEENSYDLDREGQIGCIERALKYYGYILEYDEELCKSEYEMIRKAYTSKFIDASNFIEDMIGNLARIDNEKAGEYWDKYSEMRNYSDTDEDEYIYDILYPSFEDRKAYANYLIHQANIDDRDVEAEYRYCMA